MDFTVPKAAEMSRPTTEGSSPAANWLHELGDAAHTLAVATQNFVEARRIKEEADARYQDCITQVLKERENGNV